MSRQIPQGAAFSQCPFSPALWHKPRQGLRTNLSIVTSFVNNYCGAVQGPSDHHLWGRTLFWNLVQDDLGQTTTTTPPRVYWRQEPQSAQSRPTQDEVLPQQSASGHSNLKVHYRVSYLLSWLILIGLAWIYAPRTVWMYVRSSTFPARNSLLIDGSGSCTEILGWVTFAL